MGDFDWDGLWLCAAVGCLAIGHLLHARWLKAQGDAIIAQGEEIAFLRSALCTIDAERAE